MERPTVTTRPLEVTDTGHLTEFRYDDGENDDVLVCAAHGGRVEPGTAEQAIELATRLPAASCWATMGYDEARAEFEVYHPPSTAMDPDDYPLLGELADRGFETVVSLHGQSDAGVLVGGGTATATKWRVRDALDDALAVDVAVVDSGPYAGVSPENFVNWLAEGDGGLQLEQGPGVRDDERDAVVATLAGLVGADAL